METKALFLNSILKFLQSRRHTIHLDKLRLVARYIKYSKYNPFKELRFAMYSNIKELELDFYGSSKYIQNVPPELFSSITIKSFDPDRAFIGKSRFDSKPSFHGESHYHEQLRWNCSFDV